MAKRVKGDRPKKGGLRKRLLHWTAGLIVGFYALIALSLVALRWINPPTTTVQAERRVESWIRKTPYHKRYSWVPLGKVSADFQHAVISAEDGHFYHHHGFDWDQIQVAVEDDLEKGRVRGASTIDQQLVKNLFLGTSRSIIRKGIEVTIVPIMEVILPKQRILELYLNVIEWGPGIWGAEAAARHYYDLPASQIDRDSGARLAAILPSPRRRKPSRMDNYSAIILRRMKTVGW